jgi:hypothetical protein
VPHPRLAAELYEPIRAPVGMSIEIRGVSILPGSRGSGLFTLRTGILLRRHGR